MWPQIHRKNSGLLQCKSLSHKGMICAREKTTTSKVQQYAYEKTTSQLWNESSAVTLC